MIIFWVWFWYRICTYTFPYMLYEANPQNVFDDITTLCRLGRELFMFIIILGLSLALWMNVRSLKMDVVSKDSLIVFLRGCCIIILLSKGKHIKATLFIWMYQLFFSSTVCSLCREGRSIHTVHCLLTLHRSIYHLHAAPPALVTLVSKSICFRICSVLHPPFFLPWYQRRRGGNDTFHFSQASGSACNIKSRQTATLSQKNTRKRISCFLYIASVGG